MYKAVDSAEIESAPKNSGRASSSIRDTPNDVMSSHQAQKAARGDMALQKNAFSPRSMFCYVSDKAEQSSKDNGMELQGSTEMKPSPLTFAPTSDASDHRLIPLSVSEEYVGWIGHLPCGS
mmetsp:Transcript_43431/g.92310  ORF Transcript_43431/g.92310 Transcript_43431/m.92310 type:complete len:121 (-) Transcript_43431:577-939(-)